MSADLLVSRWTAPARRRGMAHDLLVGLPAPILLAALAWRLAGPAAALALGLAGLAAIAVVAMLRARRFDRLWLTRRLDARPEMEDSTDLLFAAPAALNPLQQLQRDRLERQLAAQSEAGLAPAWNVRRLLLLWTIALVAAAAILFWPHRRSEIILTPSSEGGPVRPGVPRLVAQNLTVVPPAYTGLPATSGGTLDVRAPAGAVLRWTLRFAPQPRAAALTFLNGTRLALRRQGDVWTAARRLDRSLLYRVSPQGGVARPAPPLHRLEAVADMAPQIRVVTPAQTLTPIAAGQRDWRLLFEVRDDHGVAPAARLRITIAQGEGENVTFSERALTLQGIGDRHRRRFAATLDLAALGFTAGGDLVAQLTAADNRPSGPQVVRSPSLILRWPSRAGADGTGLDGAVKKVMPAYFRSQRQIIIDAEALLKQRRRLSADDFLARADTIGADQRLLRLRYGQFLGEEAEGGPKPPPPPTSDAPTAEDAPAAPAADLHDHESAPPSPTFGNAGNVLADYGHVHDESEAATLLDPGTRATLKSALDNMWSSELNLRQGNPQAALPYAYKALRFIKQVQQATRIFLARVGPDLPAIDPARRMTGKRDGLASRELTLDPREGVDAVPAAAWRALAVRPVGAASGLGPLAAWPRGQGGRVADPLAFAAAIDAVRRDPGCTACRERLRGLIWAALSRPPANVTRRPRADAAGRRYLEAIR